MEGNTGLMALCRRGAISDIHDIRDVVNRYGAACNPGHANDDGDTAIILACKNQHLMLAAALLDAFGDVCNIGHVNKDGKTALMLIVSETYDETEACQLIAQFGGFGVACAPGHVNHDGDTALMLACKHEQFANAAALITTFGDACSLGHINGEGNTALTLALSPADYIYSDEEVYQLIAQFCGFGAVCAPGHVNNDGDTALMIACRDSRLACAAVLVDIFGDACNPGHANEEGDTALILAAHDNANELIAQFGGFGVACAPGHVNNDGDTALMIACTRTQFKAATSLVETFGAGCFMRGTRSQLLHTLQEALIVRHRGWKRCRLHRCALEALQFAQLVLTARETDTLRLEMLRACSPSQRDIASTLVSGITTQCPPKLMHNVIRAFAVRWTQASTKRPDWTPVLLAALSKLLELGGTKVPQAVHNDTVKCCVMELAIEKDENLSLRLLDVLAPFTKTQRKIVLCTANDLGRQNVVERLLSTGKALSKKSKVGHTVPHTSLPHQRSD